MSKCCYVELKERINSQVLLVIYSIKILRLGYRAWIDKACSIMTSGVVEQYFSITESPKAILTSL